MTQGLSGTMLGEEGNDGESRPKQNPEAESAGPADREKIEAALRRVESGTMTIEDAELFRQHLG